MKRILSFIFLITMLQSCVPLRIAPSIDDYKLTKGKKFKRGLPGRTVFIFEDPKEKGVNEFYNYVNSKFQLEHENVYDDVPFNIRGQQYFFSFYEIDIPDKAINFLPILLMQCGILLLILKMMITNLVLQKLDQKTII